MKKVINFLKKVSKPDILMASTALIVSVCALGVSFYEAGLMRKQHEDSVWPYVDVGTSFRETEFHLNISNKGVGPAIIKSMQIKLDDEPIIQWEGFLKKHFGDSISYSCSSINGNVLSANEEVRVVQIKDPEVSKTLWQMVPRFEIEIVYCSIHNECWKLHDDREKINFKGETPHSLCY